MRLRRSFSLEYVNDDTSTVFLADSVDHDNHSGQHHSHHASSIHSSGTTSAPGITSSAVASTSSGNDSKGLSPFHIHSGPTITLNTSPHSSGHSSSGLTTNGLVTPWHENPDIEDALAADFDGSLSGLGMEVGSSPYNMSDALMALPTLKNEHFSSGFHHRHHHHGHHHHRDISAPSSSYHHSHSNHEIGGQGSNSNQDQDVRPVAIVHGKKNRLALGHDDEASVSSGIKRVCISNERDSSPLNEASTSSRFTAIHNNNNAIVVNQHENHQQQNHSIHSRESSLDSVTDGCGRHDCDHSLSKCNKHSSSAPELRVGQHHRLVHQQQQQSLHSNESSPSPSLLSQMLGTQHHNQHNLLHHVNGEGNSPGHHHHEGNNDSYLPLGSPVKKSSEASFQYTLGAATSAATKLHEETMTYLNQGQSYEIKLRKVSDAPARNLKRVRTIIRVGFHERRLQFMESELIDQWREQRHSERILEIDIPLSYGINDVSNDPLDINKCSFIWDTTKDTGIFIKVNCISTEFTPKKHGGEKGVPFRIIIETHAFPSSSVIPSRQTLLHAASSQVKVFKPKGADRKHKTDREKLSKKGHMDQQDKYRPSYDYTVFTECPLDQFYSKTGSASGEQLSLISGGKRTATDSPAAVVSPERKFSTASSSSNTTSDGQHHYHSNTDGPLDFTSSHSRAIIRNLSSSIATASLSNDEVKSSLVSPLSPLSSIVSSHGINVNHRKVTVTHHSPASVVTTPLSPTSVVSNINQPLVPIPSPGSSLIQLRPDSSPAEATHFLLYNRFDKYMKIFANYSGSDLLRLSRNDLTQLCSDSDGIRLYNCLHHHPQRHPRCTIYVTLSSSVDEFSALYLENLTEKELRTKLANLLTSQSCSPLPNAQSSPSITRIRMKGPQNILINVTDDFVEHIQPESMYVIDFEKDGNNNCYRVIMKNYVG